ncbi:MAG TPA: hypothetical protein VKS78_15925 [Roseiarcus sp.]|nr:hypothetical protein [Roseiarcus sp.]
MDKERTKERESEKPVRSLERLKAASSDLKQRINEQRRRHDLPLDSALGNPDEEERNADGHLDLPDNDED